MKTSYDQQTRTEFGNDRFPEKLTFRLQPGQIPETDCLQIKLSLKSEETITIDLTPQETEKLHSHWLKRRERREREHRHLIKCVVEVVKMLGTV